MMPGMLNGRVNASMMDVFGLTGRWGITMATSMTVEADPAVCHKLSPLASPRAGCYFAMFESKLLLRAHRVMGPVMDLR
jgi:hypothetical protein